MLKLTALLTKGRAGVGLPLYQTKENEFHLTTAEKKRILLNNIYGVDIDSQAVEVTKLSLLLKVLEGETDESLNSQLSMFRQRALPDLSNNIKCGNSLIGPDFYDQTELNLDEEERYRINVFDWNSEFKEIMKDGGFDCVIGNPPYGALFSKYELKYLRDNYRSALAEVDSYLVFTEKAIHLSKKYGRVSYIIPDTWLTLIKVENFRKLLLEEVCLEKILALNESIFKNATVDPLILVFKTTIPDLKQEVEVYAVEKSSKLSNVDEIEESILLGHALQSKWLKEKRSQINIYLTEETESLVNKIKNSSETLENIIEYKAGCKPYEKGKGKPQQTSKTLAEKPFTSYKKEKEEWKILIRGNDVQRHYLKIKKPEWIKYGDWLAAPREIRIFNQPRILVQAIRNPSLKTRILATYVENEMISRINVYSLLLKKNSHYQYYHLTGILNSTLMNWYVKVIYGLHTYVITGILQIPIKKMNESNDKLFKSIFANSRKINELYNKYNVSKTPQEKTALQRQIDALDNQIDRLVYELYDLTEDEIKIVEESMK